MVFCRYLGIVGVSPTPQLHLYQQHPTVGPRSPPEPGTEPDAPSAEARALCGSLPGLAAPQMDLCLHHPSTLRSVSLGAARGIKECQLQFRNERWNCSTHADENSVFGYTLERGKN
jgi:hypothetical protein